MNEEKEIIKEVRYAELRDVFREEEEKESLVRIPNNFYLQVRDYLSKMEIYIKSKDICELEEDLNWKEWVNARATLKNLVLLRKKKIIDCAIRKIEVKNMTDEERELYEKVKKAAEEFDKKVFEENGKKVEEKAEEKIKIVIKRSLPAYKKENGKSYGPFEVGDIADVDKEEAEELVKAGFATYF